MIAPCSPACCTSAYSTVVVVRVCVALIKGAAVLIRPLQQLATALLPRPPADLLLALLLPSPSIILMIMVPVSISVAVPVLDIISVLASLLVSSCDAPTASCAGASRWRRQQSLKEKAPTGTGGRRLAARRFRCLIFLVRRRRSSGCSGVRSNGVSVTCNIGIDISIRIGGGDPHQQGGSGAVPPPPQGLLKTLHLGRRPGHGVGSQTLHDAPQQRALAAQAPAQRAQGERLRAQALRLPRMGERHGSGQRLGERELHCPRAARAARPGRPTGAAIRSAAARSVAAAEPTGARPSARSKQRQRSWAKLNRDWAGSPSRARTESDIAARRARSSPICRSQCGIALSLGFRLYTGAPCLRLRRGDGGVQHCRIRCCLRASRVCPCCAFAGLAVARMRSSRRCSGGSGAQQRVQGHALHGRRRVQAGQHARLRCRGGPQLVHLHLIRIHASDGLRNSLGHDLGNGAGQALAATGSICSIRSSASGSMACNTAHGPNSACTQAAAEGRLRRPVELHLLLSQIGSCAASCCRGCGGRRRSESPGSASGCRRLRLQLPWRRCCCIKSRGCRAGSSGSSGGRRGGRAHQGIHRCCCSCSC